MGKINDESMGNCLVSYKVMLSLRKGFEAPKYVGTEQRELFVWRKSQAQNERKTCPFPFHPLGEDLTTPKRKEEMRTQDHAMVWL